MKRRREVPQGRQSSFIRIAIRKHPRRTTKLRLARFQCSLHGVKRERPRAYGGLDALFCGQGASRYGRCRSNHERENLAAGIRPHYWSAATTHTSILSPSHLPVRSFRFTGEHLDNHVRYPPSNLVSHDPWLGFAPALLIQVLL